MTSNKRLFLDIHVIQTVPPSNINRDDTGSPKTAQYGGTRRARVSSQAWKKVMREYFIKYGAQENKGVRTLNVPQYVADKIEKLEPGIDHKKAFDLAKNAVNAAGIETKLNKQKKNKKEEEAEALFFIGSRQAEVLAQAALQGVKEKKTLQTILKSNLPIDIALFGRMLAKDDELNADASAQVAHAISTHAVQTEYDFFTAVDDRPTEYDKGAGMIETTEFNSSTLYRYANVAVHAFKDQLGDKEQTLQALKLFIEAFANSMPTGKSNSFANQTLPQAILVTVRKDRPVNLVSAFEEPVKSSDGYVQKSIERLFSEMKAVDKFVCPPAFTLYVTGYDMPDADIGQAQNSLMALLDTFYEAMDGLLPEKAE